jgi:hypothetical protein
MRQDMEGERQTCYPGIAGRQWTGKDHFLLSCACIFIQGQTTVRLPNHLFMSDSFHPLLQELIHNEELLAAALLGIVAVLVLLFLFRARLKNWRQERKIGKVIRRLGVRSMKNIRLPDGTGGEVTIEHLLLGRDAIHVVGVMRFEGLIFGSSHTDQWTQVINRHSYKFDNPDNYLQRQIDAIRLIAPGVAVSGWHLFGHSAEFPKDKPDNVLQPGDIRSLPRRPRRREIPKQLRAAWKQLVKYRKNKSAFS